MWSTAFLPAALLVACEVSAGLIGDISRVGRRDSEIERLAQRMVDSLSAPAIEERQISASSPTVNMTDWELRTEAACVQTLSKLNGVSTNPSGLELCYNIVSLDKSNGSFYADMRIYMIAPGTADFVNVPVADVTVAAQYSGATVQTISQSGLQRREISFRSDVLGKRATTPTLVQSYALFGILNMTGVASTTTVAQYETLLAPTVTLSAVVSGRASPVTATLSAKEASFIQGVFANQESVQALAGPTPEKPTMTGIAAVVVPEGTLFLMPGTKILIFPIGAIITGSWAVMLLSTIAYGTVGRMNFREQFRRRTARAQKSQIGTI